MLTGIILAGGKSCRMGINKALLPLRGRPMIECLITTLSQVVDAVLLITNQPDPYTYLKRPIFTDLIPDCGPLGGIYTGLVVSSTRYNLVLACDMPFLDLILLKRLGQEIQNTHADVIIPQTADGLQPLCAVYSKSCIAAIGKQLETGNCKVVDFFDQVHVHVMACLEKSSNEPGNAFYNINTIEAYVEAQQIASKTLKKS